MAEKQWAGVGNLENRSSSPYNMKKSDPSQVSCSFNRCSHDVPRAFEQGKRKSDESYICTILNNVEYWWTEIPKKKITGKYLKLYNALWGTNME